MALTIDASFAKLGFETHMGMLDFEVSVGPSGPALLAAMEDGAELRMQELIGEAASTDPVIAKVRSVFKAMGKDPSRYRPSSEAITRRILSGKGLTSVNNVVDCGNLISLMTGIPIGCYDAAWINGDITLRPGKNGESYKGIGRTKINLENLPLLADKKEAFGSPFSDSMHTAVSEKTRHLKVALFGLGVDIAHVEAASEMVDTLFTRFCAPDD